MHRSVLEWLIAQEAAEQLIAAQPPDVLDKRQISDLLADFILDRAGEDAVGQWVAKPGSIADRDAPNQAIRRKNRITLQTRLVLRRPETSIAVQDWPGSEAAQTTPPRDLTSQDLRDLDLSVITRPDGRGLQGALLESTIWRGMSLIELDLSNARLQGADFTGTHQTGVVLDGADLSRAEFGGAHLSNVSLRGANLTGVKLRGVRFTRCDLRDVATEETLWDGVTLFQTARPAISADQVSGRGIVDGDELSPSGTVRSGGPIQAVAHLPELELLG